MDMSQIHDYTLEELEEILDEACDTYYNSNKTTLTDDEFDFVKEFLISKYPYTKYATKIGHNVKGTKVQLPYYMGSMDKFKDEKKIVNWLKTYDSGFVIMSKLDGISALYVKNGISQNLYTRGNGSQGKDISHLLKYLNIPDTSVYTDLVVRGEILIKNSTFDKLDGDISNPRNYVSGLVNSHKPDPKKIGQLDFVSYEMMYPQFKISEQLRKCRKIGFNTVQHISVKCVSHKQLSQELDNFKSKSPYLIDGIIIRHNENYPHNTSGNPKYAFAFKKDSIDQITTATIKTIHWNVSKYGILKPQIEIKPVTIGGVNIRYITGKNARYIYDNNIGIGTIVKIIRSGDVIPNILEVIKPSKEPTMPDDYEWDCNYVEIKSIDESDEDLQNIKLITFFFKTIKVDNLGPGIVQRLYDEEYDTVKKILRIKKVDLLQIEGFKETLATKITENIKTSLADISVIDLMVASSIFGRGFGRRKLELLYYNIPNLMSLQANNALIDRIISIDGFSTKTATQFVQCFDTFKVYLKDLNIKNYSIDVDTKKAKLNKNIVFTGFRNNSLETELEKVGYYVNNTINSETYMVVTKDINSASSKLKTARQKNIKIVNLDDFIKLLKTL